MLTTAAILIFATGLAHSVLGERYILVRLFKRGNLPALLGGTAFTAGTLRFAWHLTTVAWWGLAVVTLLASRPSFSPRDVLHVIGIVSLVSALFPIVFTRGRHLSWVAFVAVAVLVFLAAGNMPT